MNPSDVRNKLPQIALYLTLLVLAASDVMLIRQNLLMRAELNKLKPDVLELGDKVPSFSAVGLEGSPLNLNFSGKEPKRVLLFFTPTCPYCREQFAYWRQLLKQADANRFEILGVVADSENREKLNEYLSGVSPAPGLRVALVSDDVKRAYKLSRTPITLVIANDGKVDNVWVGKWNPETIRKAAAVFNVSFSPLPDHHPN
jgi:peroxiredoxin